MMALCKVNRRTARLYARGLTVLLVAAACAAGSTKNTYIGYEGKLRPDSEVAIFRLEKVDWLIVGDTVIKKDEFHEVRLLPGKQLLRWGRRALSIDWPFVWGMETTEGRMPEPVLLEAGHIYTVNALPRPGVYLWIEDLDTGYIVAGEKPSRRMTKEQKEIRGYRSHAQMRFMKAAAEGDLDTVMLMLESGVDIDSKDVRQQTALMHAIFKRQPEVVLNLLENGADPNIQDIFGQTALIYAAAENRIAEIDLLLEHGADVNKMTIETVPTKLSVFGSVNALMVAAALGAEEAVRRLLRHPETDVDASGHLGVTALMYGSWFKKTGVVKVLIENGAKLNVTDRRGSTSLDWARGRDVKNVLREAGAKKGKEM
jgi:ankyrin repeat protein